MRRPRRAGIEKGKVIDTQRKKYVYRFGNGEAEGSGELKELLGGKGAGLAEMSLLGIPVPPGFTLTTEACLEFQRLGGNWPVGLDAEVEEHLHHLERALQRRFGDPKEPLLVSVRSGAVHSMPGMMDTVLNLGLNDAIVGAQSAVEDGGRFFKDCYRRLLMMFGDVVRGLPHGDFEREMAAARSESRAESDQNLPLEALDRVIDSFQGIYKRHGASFPQEPLAQLKAAIGAVFSSWNNRRAREYRRLHDISDDLGTGATVQAMVFGNRGPDCATGVAFTRNPATGEPAIYGEYLVNAQGEDVVAGTHTPHPLQPSDGEAGLGADFPEAWEKLQEVCRTLERHFRNMQDVEFTIEGGRLFMLQTRVGKRSGPAAVRLAVDMVEERLIDRREALRRVEPQHLVQMMAPVFDARERRRAVEEGRLLGRGLPAGPGAAAGRIAFTAERAAEWAPSGPVLLVRDETSPEDIVGMHASSGILTTRGGMTSHAAVVARGLGKPCVVGASGLQVDDEAGVLRVGERTFAEGSELSIDGTGGEVLEGAIEARPSAVQQAVLEGNEKAKESPAVRSFLRLLVWADRERKLGVRANADTPEDAAVARTFGAGGIGLCRTEHMFFAEDRISSMRELILARSEEERRKALDRLLPMQEADFEGIFRALAGLPVTIRLLDPPLHEFLPHGEQALARLGQQMGIGADEVADKAESLVEVNPMLGHRGCRLGLTAPAVYEMQTEAIVSAACAVAREGVEVQPEIMVPLVGIEEELRRLRERIEAVVQKVIRREGQEVEVLIGTMIEVPRAALMASTIARHADFFSFGTNDLTQMTYGFSRDDVGRFLPQYLEDGILASDPFERLDVEGVGQLVELACRRGRMARPDLKLGVCGEHGGEPHSIEFFARCGLDYVSCSPYRLPVARLAAARAALAAGAGKKAESAEH